MRASHYYLYILHAPNQIIVNAWNGVFLPMLMLSLPQTTHTIHKCLKCRFKMAEIIINCCKLLSIKMILSGFANSSAMCCRQVIVMMTYQWLNKKMTHIFRKNHVITCVRSDFIVCLHLHTLDTLTHREERMWFKWNGSWYLWTKINHLNRSLAIEEVWLCAWVPTFFSLLHRYACVLYVICQDFLWQSFFSQFFLFAVWSQAYSFVPTPLITISGQS